MKKQTIYLVMFVLLLCSAYAEDLYNVTKLGEANNLLDYTLAANALVDNYIGLGIILISFLIPTLMVLNTQKNIMSGILIGGFFSSLTSVFFVLLGLVDKQILIICSAITAVSFFVTMLFTNGGE